LGEDYNIEDLLFRSLAYSDNNAYFLLVQYAMSEFGQEAMIEFLRQLGVISSSQSTDDIVTVRGYSSIFRLLYNGSLINSGLSEKVLSWLSQSTFTDGLVAGVPQNIRVSHKFGEFGFVETGKYQLHDCGIVYYPENPYLLCIMTRGGDVRALAGIIAEVSRRVYQEVDSRRL
jgi:beta-lactamase class A